MTRIYWDHVGLRLSRRLATEIRCGPAAAHAHIRRRTSRRLPAEPPYDDIFSKNLAEAEHDAVNKWQEHVYSKTGDHGQHSRLRRELRVEDGRRRSNPVGFSVTMCMLMVTFVVFVQVSVLVHRHGGVWVGGEVHGRIRGSQVGRDIFPFLVLR